MKKRKELKKTVCITIEAQQERDLKELARYTGKNVSEVVRELLPSAEEIEAWEVYQDFCDSLSEPHREELFNKIRKASRLFFEVAMAGNIQVPIGLQVAAVSHFDKTGASTFKLFKNWINALQSIKGYKFVSDKHKFPGSPDKIFFSVLSPNESRADVDNLIGKFCTLAPDSEVLNAIQRSARVVKKRSKTKKKTKRDKLKTKKK